jgi:hypothetical protein
MVVNCLIQNITLPSPSPLREMGGPYTHAFTLGKEKEIDPQRECFSYMSLQRG